MKKILFLSMMLVATIYASAEIVVEKLWQATSTDVTLVSSVKSCAGWDGCFYGQDYNAKKVYKYTRAEDGTMTKTDYVSGATGYGMTIDQAGNILVRNDVYYVATPTKLNVYLKGSTTPISITFALPEGTNGRTDFISAVGDVSSAEGGYVYFYGNGSSPIIPAYVKICNAGLATQSVTSGALSDNTITASTGGSYVYPIDENHFFLQNRSNAIYYLDRTANPANCTSTTKLAGLKLSHLGGAAMKIRNKNGETKTLMAYSCAANNYYSNIKVRDITSNVDINPVEGTDMFLAVDGSASATGAQVNFLSVQKIDDYSYYLYQYCPTNGMCVYKVYENEVYCRSGLTADKFGTICLPKAVAAGELTGATAYSIVGKRMSGETVTSIVLQEETGTLVAGQPYIIKANAVSLVALYTGAEASATSYNGLVGVFEKSDVAQGMYLISNNTVKKCGSGCTIGANRAYINMEDVPVYVATPAEGRRIVEIAAGENTATSMDELNGENNVEKFIENGQVYIRRNGVVYDATGRVIR